MSDSIDIVIRDTGAEVVVRDLNNIGSTAQSSAGDVEILNSALKALAGFLAVDQLMQWSDAWNTAAGLIRVSTTNIADAAAVTQSLYDVAQKTRQSFGDVASLYQRASIAANQLGATQQQLITFTQGVGEALVIQHSSAQGASSAMNALSQMLDQNTVSMRQYRALLLNGSVILQTVAANLKGTGGSMANLTNMVKGGKLPVKDFFDAFLSGSDSLGSSFEKTSFLFSQGFTVITNAISKYVGEFADTTGVSKVFQTFVEWLSTNIPLVAADVLALGAALAVVFAPAAIEAFVGYIVTLGAFLLSNPFTAIIAALAALVTWVDLYGDSVNAGIDSTTSLKDVGRAAVADIQAYWQSLVPVLEDVWSKILGLAVAATDAIGTNNQQTVKGLEQSYSDFFATNQTGWAAFLTDTAKIVDAIVGLFEGMGYTVANVILGLPAVIEEGFQNMLSTATTYLKQIANEAIDTANEARSALGLSLYKDIAVPPASQDNSAWVAYGKKIAGSFDQGFADEAGGAQSAVATLLKQAQGIGAQRTGGPAPPAANLNAPPGAAVALVDPAAAAKAAKALAELTKQYQAVVGEINPAYNATMHLNAAQVTLTNAVKFHIITTDQMNTIMAQLTKRYQDQLDPVGAVTNKLIEQSTALSLLGDQAQAQATMVPIIEELQKKGVDLTTQQTTAIMALIVANQALAREQAAGNAVLNQTVYAQRTQIDNINAIAALQKTKAITPGQSAQSAVSAFGQDAMSNTVEANAAYLQSYNDMYAKIDAARQKDVISEQTAAALKLKADNTYLQQRLGSTQTFLGALASMQGTNSKKLAAVAKAAAIAQATIQTYTAATGAYSAMASIPYVGPFLGAAAAAAAVIAGIVNVNKIRSTNYVGFRTGGSMTVGGNGGDDSQTVAFRATPGERVTVHTPAQARALEKSGQGAPAPTPKPPIIVNFNDPQATARFLRANPDAVLNVLSDDPVSARKAINNY